MTNDQASREMVEGYMDGLDDDRDELPAQFNRSQQYQHGWRNGRDDRLHKPRASAEWLRWEADRLIQEDL